MVPKLIVRIEAVKEEAENIRSYELRSPDGTDLPVFSAGSHIDFFLPSNMIRQYSLSNDPVERHRYVVAVQKEENGRGGSSYVHTSLKPGDQIEISHPRNHFELDETAERYKLIAGGIGITPILSMARRLKSLGKPFQLYYACRNKQRAAFTEEMIASGLSGHLLYSFDDQQGPLKTQALFGLPEQGVQIYCCGPTGLMDAVKSATRSWPVGTVRFEHFSADETTGPRADDGSFEVVINSTGKRYQIPAGKSILSVLAENGIFVDNACCEGICGTCETGLLEGEADHRDMVLSDQEKTENRHIMLCCSRAKSASLTLDL
ncbi:PDR/VanB family oxidoreductase [Kiloniella laminariae]|uniref:PDR/VanB family oxidoreductase n=1 Tax=Kiloniella laminariae TaxID=454162 RepID=A0ABT4LIY9_9PROT|nr:PDR/VanB family oxidoreductase [Kiloniella laminariae]MCZ4281077.1 PDR/VanB family oxidoreductase [Kiloniella laminariae]